MLKVVKRLFPLLGMLALCVGSPSPLQAQGRFPVNTPISNQAITNPAYNWAQLDQALEQFVPRTVRGMTVMVTHKGSIVYGRAFGNQRLDSVLPLASATKMPSGIVIMKLAEQGLIDLDVPITTYLDGKVIVPTEKRNITVRMLFNHTAGFSGERYPCLSDRETTLRRCAQEILREPLVFSPGTAFAYGGGGMQIAGYIAEVVTGKSWNQLFDEIVAQPLQLTQFTYTDTENPRVAGGAYSNVADYTKILQMQLNQGKFGDQVILQPSTIAEMQRDQIVGLPIVSSPGDDRLTGYSFGWWHSRPSLHPESQGPELSDQGAFGTTPWIDGDLDYGAIILIQSRTPMGTEIWNTIRPIITEQVKRNP